MRARVDLRRGPASTIAGISAAVIVVIGVLGGGRADAQSAEAELLFTDGNKWMAEGKLAQACAAFEASNRVEPRAGTLLRLAACREQSQQLASAWSAYRDALNRAKDPQKRDYASAMATALEARLSYLTVSVPDELQIDGVTLTRNGKALEAALWNRALPVDGGDYVVAVHAPGHDWQTVAHVPVERARVTVDVPRLADLPVGGEPVTPGTVAEHHDGHVVVPSPRFTLRRKIALGAAGVSAIGVVAGAVLGESAKARQHDAFALCPDPAMPCPHADQSQALIKAGQRRALEANVGFGIAAAAALGAGVLWLTGASGAEHPARVSVAPRVVPGAPGIVVLGTF